MEENKEFQIFQKNVKWHNIQGKWDTPLTEEQADIMAALIKDYGLELTFDEQGFYSDQVQIKWPSYEDVLFILEDLTTFGHSITLRTDVDTVCSSCSDPCYVCEKESTPGTPYKFTREQVIVEKLRYLG